MIGISLAELRSKDLETMSNAYQTKFKYSLLRKPLPAPYEHYALWNGVTASSHSCQVSVIPKLTVYRERTKGGETKNSTETKNQTKNRHEY